jgi:hypothetical protein
MGRGILQSISSRNRRIAMTPETFSILVQRFFGHLRSERNVSEHTICAYRDSFRLFLRYLTEQRRLRPEKVTFEAFSPEVILGFLGHIEAARGNTIRTRNSRLTAIRAFVRFTLSQGVPKFLPVGQRILNIPIKRANKPLLGFMDSRRSMPFSAPSTYQPGPADAIICFSPCFSTRVDASPKFCRCVPEMFAIALFTCTGKAAKIAKFPSGHKLKRQSAAGANTTGRRTLSI